MGAKQTAALIPLCHNIFLSKVDVHATLQQESCSLLITAEASTTSETGTASSLWGSEGATLCMWAHGLPAEGSQQHHTAVLPCMAFETGVCSVVAHDCSCGRRAAAPILQHWEQVCQPPHLSLTAVC